VERFNPAENTFEKLKQAICKKAGALCANRNLQGLSLQTKQGWPNLLYL